MIDDIDPQHPPLRIIHTWRPAAAQTQGTAMHPTPALKGKWNFRKSDFQSLYTAIATLDWNHLYETTSVDDAMDSLYTTINCTIDAHTPLKKTGPQISISNSNILILIGIHQI